MFTNAESGMKKVKNFVLLHLCILWYTETSILSKAASSYKFLSIEYIICYGLIIVVLGIYAIFWQQVIKPFEPSIAYSNKSISLVWTMLFSSWIFNEKITICNAIGAVIIITGVIMVARDE